MPFDFDLAVARLDAQAEELDTTAMAALRPRYPELDFIFDLLVSYEYKRAAYDELKEEFDETVCDLREAEAQISALERRLRDFGAALRPVYELIEKEV